MTVEKQKTTSKRQGPLNRWRTSASLGSQRAGIPVHLRSLWITCTKTTRLSEKDPSQSQQNFPNTVSGDPAGPRKPGLGHWLIALWFQWGRDMVQEGQNLLSGVSLEWEQLVFLTSSQRPVHPTQTEILPSPKVTATVIRSQMKATGLDTVWCTFYPESSTLGRRAERGQVYTLYRWIWVPLEPLEHGKGLLPREPL